MQKNGIVFSVLGLLFFIKKGIHNLILLWTPYYKLFTLHYSLFIKPSNVVRGHGFTICLINYYLENKKPYSLKTNTIILPSVYVFACAAISQGEEKIFMGSPFFLLTNKF